MLVQTPSTHINIRSVTQQRNLSALSPQPALYAGITARSAIIDVYLQASNFFPLESLFKRWPRHSDISTVVQQNDKILGLFILRLILQPEVRA